MLCAIVGGIAGALAGCARSKCFGVVHYPVSCSFRCFFFQAEDGIRDIGVTGVQTCALPISSSCEFVPADERRAVDDLVVDRAEVLQLDAGAALGVEQVERDALRRGGRVELDRNRDQPERDRPGPGGVCRHRLHDSTMLPIMREGLIPPTDSAPQTTERRHLGGLTALSALVLVAVVALVTWLHFTGSRVADVPEPEHALAGVVGHSLDLDDGIDGASAWERRLYQMLLGGRADDLADALRWHEGLEAESLAPTVDLHLAILEGEAGRSERLRRRLDEWDRRGEPFETFGLLVGSAYLEITADGADVDDLVAEADAELGPGWFRDRLVARLTRSEVPNPRAGVLLGRLRVLTAAEVAILAAALVMLASWARRCGERGRWGAATLPPPWL